MWKYNQKILLIIGSLLCFAFILELGMRIGGLVYKVTPLQQSATKKDADVYKIVCLGESTTCFGGPLSYPRQLAEVLHERFPDRKFSVINKGVPGIDTIGIVAELDEILTNYEPDLVITMMGINDGFVGSGYVKPRGNWFSTLRIYQLCRLLWNRLADNADIDAMRLKLAERKKKLMSEYEQTMQQSMRRNPKDHHSYCLLASYYCEQEDFLKAEKLYAEALANNPYGHEAYLELAMYHCEFGTRTKAETALLQAIQKSPDNYLAYIKLVQYYYSWGRNEEAAVLLQRLCSLSQSGVSTHRYPADEDMMVSALKNILRIDPKNIDVHIELADIYQENGLYEKAVELYEKAISINPDKAYWAYIAIGELYRSREQYDEAEKILLEGISVNLESPWILDTLASVLVEKELACSGCHIRQNSSWNPQYYNAVTKANYNTLVESAHKRGVAVAIMQYPTLPVAPLRAMIDHPEWVIFIDNEKVFDEAIAVYGYYAYFYDRFAHSFGHCTKYGNRLLAEHVAVVLAEEIIK